MQFCALIEQFNPTFMSFDVVIWFLSDFRPWRQEWMGKSGRKHVQGRKHEENKDKNT